jgi:hypothetical protein
MTTELIEAPATRAAQVIVLGVTDETIEAMSGRVLAMKIIGVADKDGLALMKATQRECQKARTSIDKSHEELKRETLKYGQALDAERRRLQAKLAPLESHCVNAVAAVQAELDAIAKSEADRVYKIRVDLMSAAGGQYQETILRAMSEAQFHASVQMASEKTKAAAERAAADKAAAEERQRQADEQAEANQRQREELAVCQAAFDKRQAEQQAIFDAQHKAQQEVEAKLIAESQRLARLEAARVAEVDRKRIADEAAAQAVIDTEARLQREAQEREDQRLADEAAARRAELLKPAKAKLLRFADRILKLEAPTIDGEVDQAVLDIINDAVRQLCHIAQTLR